MRKAATPLQNIRRARTLTQAQIARVLRITQQTYSKYEAGVIVPPRDMKTRIAAVLGVSIDDIFPQDEEKVSA